MSIYGSIAELQRAIVKLYINLEQRLNENKLIRELWAQMASDMSRQIACLHDFPKSFWIVLLKDEKGLAEYVQSAAIKKSFENKEDSSLRDCIQRAIDAEEEIVLKVYVPIIRSLRKSLTNPALEFYILVNAHLVRIKRASESFAGDPELIHRSAQLFQLFEKEIQEPPVVRKPPKAKTAASGKTVPAKSQTNKKTAQTERPKLKKTEKRSRPVIKSAKIRLARPSPLVKKADIRRKRARR